MLSTYVIKAQPLQPQLGERRLPQFWQLFWTHCFIYNCGVDCGPERKLLNEWVERSCHDRHSMDFGYEITSCQCLLDFVLSWSVDFCHIQVDLWISRGTVIKGRRRLRIFFEQTHHLNRARKNRMQNESVLQKNTTEWRYKAWRWKTWLRKTANILSMDQYGLSEGKRQIWHLNMLKHLNTTNIWTRLLMHTTATHNIVFFGLNCRC